MKRLLITAILLLTACGTEPTEYQCFEIVDKRMVEIDCNKVK